jgi:hypothetical protein
MTDQTDSASQIPAADNTLPKGETPKEKYSVKGEDLLGKIKNLINEGNVRKITISDKEGKEIAAFPLTVGVIGAVLAPILAAIGAIAALVTECTITVERKV